VLAGLAAGSPAAPGPGGVSRKVLPGDPDRPQVSTEGQAAGARGPARRGARTAFEAGGSRVPAVTAGAQGCPPARWRAAAAHRSAAPYSWLPGRVDDAGQPVRGRRARGTPGPPERVPRASSSRFSTRIRPPDVAVGIPWRWPPPAFTSPDSPSRTSSRSRDRCSPGLAGPPAGPGNPNSSLKHRIPRPPSSSPAVTSSPGRPRTRSARLAGPFRFSAYLQEPVHSTPAGAGGDPRASPAPRTLAAKPGHRRTRHPAHSRTRIRQRPLGKRPPGPTRAVPPATSGHGTRGPSSTSRTIPRQATRKNRKERPPETSNAARPPHGIPPACHPKISQQNHFIPESDESAYSFCLGR